MKKMRLLALGLVAQLCFSHAYALGVRAIEVKSGLDQKLHAEIMLTDVSDKPLFFAVRATSEGQNIKDIGYVLQKNKSGEDVLKITSQRPINKAVLNLDVLGREGKQQVLADSYTIMLDPVAKPAEASFEHYGPVKKGQSLDSVAAEVKPVYVQLNIAKQAIKMANPHAFENGNSQKLIEGSFLIIPDLAFHISENQVTNETKIAELNIQFQALAKELSAGLEGVSTKHGSLAQKVLDIEAKMSAILESIAAVERGQKAIYAKLREHDQALAARKEEPLGGEFTWLSAGILIVILAIIWLAYRLVRRYRANQVEDGPDGSSGKAKKSLKDLIKKDKVSLNNQQDKAVETPSESAEENIEEEKPSSNDQPKKGYDARTISDDDLLISEKR